MPWSGQSTGNDVYLKEYHWPVTFKAKKICLQPFDMVWFGVLPYECMPILTDGMILHF